ncbi:hypothetical protein QN239_31760 [Mycolicibacterium sp. Y3]
MIAGAIVIFVISAAAAIPLGNRLRIRADIITAQRQLPHRGHTLEDIS